VLNRKFDCVFFNTCGWLTHFVSTLYANDCFFSILDESDKKFDSVKLFEEAALQTLGMSSTIVQTVNDKNRKFYFKLNQFKN
jgi:hypothetical protein